MIKNTERKLNGGDVKPIAGNDQVGRGNAQISPKSPSTPTAQEAMALLRRDHESVSELFGEYETINVQSRKKSLVVLICADLTIHAQVGEEIFYPALHDILKDKRLAPRAIGEHAKLKRLVAEIECVEMDSEAFDAKFKVLSEYMRNHVQEEENHIFPRATATKLDMLALGARVASRREELAAERACRA